MSKFKTAFIKGTVAIALICGFVNESSAIPRYRIGSGGCVYIVVRYTGLTGRFETNIYLGQTGNGVGPCQETFTRQY